MIHNQWEDHPAVYATLAVLLLLAGLIGAVWGPLGDDPTPGLLPRLRTGAALAAILGAWAITWAGVIR